MNVTFSDLRINTNNLSNSTFLLKFWDWYGELFRDIWEERSDEYEKFKRTHSCNDCNQCCLLTLLSSSVAMIFLIFGPFYVISRFITLFYPVFIVLYLYFGYNVNIWYTKDIDVFQIIMITIYIILCAILSILFYYNIKEQYLMAHILPSKGYLERVVLDEEEMKIKIKKITNHYFGMTVIPIRRAMIIEFFGRDLGPIIVSYLPNDDNFDTIGDVLIVKTVV